jgi:hypothetical protein
VGQVVRARADQAHLAAEHVDDLGQFVEPRPPQEPAQPRHALRLQRVVGAAPRRSRRRRMVRNLHRRKGRQPRPMRSRPVEHGPGVQDRVQDSRQAATKKQGISTTAEKVTSNRRFGQRVGHRPARGRGGPARWRAVDSGGSIRCSIGVRAHPAGPGPPEPPSPGVVNPGCTNGDRPDHGASAPSVSVTRSPANQVRPYSSADARSASTLTPTLRRIGAPGPAAVARQASRRRAWP